MLVMDASIAIYFGNKLKKSPVSKFSSVSMLSIETPKIKNCHFSHVIEIIQKFEISDNYFEIDSLSVSRDPRIVNSCVVIFPCNSCVAVWHFSAKVV